MKKVLISDDDSLICELLEYHLKKQGFVSTIANDGKAAFEYLSSDTFDLILLDLMMPYINGLDLISLIREKNKETPIIVISAKGDEDTIISALDLGADSFINKPFSASILMATVKSVLRRSKVTYNNIELGDLKINISQRTVTNNGINIELSSTEFNILAVLASNKGRVYTRNQLISKCKGDNYVVSERTIDVQVAGLRKKLGPLGSMIKTVWAIGYKLDT